LKEAHAMIPPMRWFPAVLALLVLAPAACRKHRGVTARRHLSGLDARADKFVRQVARGAFKDARAAFDDKMLSAMPEESLSAGWLSLIDRVGAFRGVASFRQEERDGYRAVIVTTKHAKLPVDVRVVFDRDEKIAGLWFAPAKIEWRAPPYVKANTFTESELSVRDLPGTLTLPKSSGPFRAVVLVHGSGPNDRDESIGAYKPFRDLAHGLASRGIAVLRYDKRSKVAPASLRGAFDQDDEVSFDARAAVAVLAARSDIDGKHIVIVGHSQGASMAPRIARGTPSIAAIALLAGDTRPFERLVLDQHRYLYGLQGLDGETSAKKLEALRDEFRRVRSEGPSDELLEVIGARAPRRYWRDLLDHKGDAIARELSIPMFVAQGGRDYQVTIEDFEGWKSALGSRSDVTFRLYPSLNHAFVAGDGPSTPEEYNWPGHVDATVVQDLATWIGSLP
jgi:uncharacterized protein